MSFHACEKDHFVPDDNLSSDYFDEDKASESIAKIGKLTPSEIRTIIKAVSTNSNKSTVDPIAVLDSVLQTTGLIVQNKESGSEVITFLYKDKGFDNIYNLVFERLNGEITSGYLLEFVPESNFLQDFTSFKATVGDFRGTIHVKPISSFAKLLQKNNEDCFRVVFDSPYSPSTGGGGGTADETGGKPSSNPNFGRIYGPHGGNSGDSGDSGGGGGSSGGGSTADPCREELIAITYRGADGNWYPGYIRVSKGDCNGNGINDEDEKSVIPSSANKTLSSDCGQIFSEIGVLFRPIRHRLSGKETDFIDNVANGLPYNVNALYSFLDVAALQSCTGNENSAGSCIRAQVKNYIKEQVRVEANGGLQVSYAAKVDNITDHAVLADFFHALYGSGGNENMVNASRYALEHLNSPEMQGDLAGQLTHLGIASSTLGDSFRSHASAVSNIASRLCGTLTSSGFRFLLGSTDILNGISDFLRERNDSEDAAAFADFAANLLSENEEYKWERLKELNELIEENPEALVEDCPPSLDDWEDLINFELSGVALDRINNSNGTWDILPIHDARGSLINLDYFSVVVDELPIRNGRRMSPQEFFDHFRLNINDFAPKFKPYDDPYDVNLWNSSNPLGTVMEIEIETFLGIVDIVDGDVICSQYEDCCWVFSTLSGTPIYGSGYHPVSGNRQFAYTYIDDIFVLYTSGADRTTTWYHNIDGTGEIAYEAGSQFWRGMQNKISDFVSQNGGQIHPLGLQEVIKHPNWENVKSLLSSTTPVTSIPCH